MKPTKLIPITQFIDIPEGISIASEHLELVSLSDLPRHTTLMTMIGTLNVLIHKEGELWVRVIRKVRADDPLAEKYGARNVARTMSNATGLIPKDEEEAKRLPYIESAGWNVPDEVWWKLRLPTSATGAQVLAAVRVSDEFIMKMTEQLLTDQRASV